ncbi:GDP-mannose 4,6-dehydratase [Microbacterium cremeum]|uniref:GDP-mannose 4,6-dehydratase n=1 Tax=Microbacterium cremeum TaxID=2782169 RepID=UPI001888C9BD|nr:GDP-mannose 4,6-dehydratase [Microbacterium cremeum]
MSRALVTGITGQTGSYLAEHLLAHGWEVHGLVRHSDSSRAAFSELAPAAELHTGDLADLDGIVRLVRDVQPTSIFNLGGLSSVARSWDDPIAAATITGLPVSALLDAALRLQESRDGHVSFVQASSAEIFGVAETSPQDESTPVRPSNPYGAAKAYGHHLVGVYRARGLAASSCILYNHESPRRPAEFVTRKITRGAARIRLGLQENLTLGNLEARRDWGWAPDFARALAAAATHPDDYVIATGVSHSVRDFAAAAFSAVGINDWEPLVTIDTALLRHGDAAVQAGNASRARDVLGWKPSVTFEEMVRRMVEADLAEASNPEQSAHDRSGAR